MKGRLQPVTSLARSHLIRTRPRIAMSTQTQQHPPSSRALSRQAAGPRPRVAVLYQALEPPVVNGVRKPPKPGGYRDSGADIAWTLQQQQQQGAGGVDVVTPAPRPDPRAHDGWCFPDTEAGVRAALAAGATHLWANTILFADHPLQTSRRLWGEEGEEEQEKAVRVVGQPPRLVELGDDKALVNALLRADGSFTLPRGAVAHDLDAVRRAVGADGPALALPVVAKPVRGRGSHGVAVCATRDALLAHAAALLAESPAVLLEEYLAGQEATVTVMPPSTPPSSSSTTSSSPSPSPPHDDYWALPVVVRFNHVDGVAPYNGAVAVTANSRVVAPAEAAADPAFAAAADQCVRVARLLRCTAPIRIDVRRFREGAGFALFDVNMKPVGFASSPSSPRASMPPRPACDPLLPLPHPRLRTFRN